MVKAFQDYQRLSGKAHVLATVLRNMFNFHKNDKVISMYNLSLYIWMRQSVPSRSHLHKT